MRLFNILSKLALSICIGAISIGLPGAAQAQSALNLRALELLAPFSTLLNTPAGKAALAANLATTGAIQNGTSGQPGLQSFPNAQAQALKDATVTSGNGYELADGLGSKLGGAYQSRTSAFFPLPPRRTGS